MRIAATRDQMREIDRIAVEEFGIPGAVLMENAGRAVADEALRLRGNDPLPVVVAAGPGNNGGDGFVAARHMMNRGAPVSVFYLGEIPASPATDAGRNLSIAVKMGVRVLDLATDGLLDRLRDSLASCSVAVDAMLGTGSRGKPRGPVAAAIALLNSSGRKILAVDLPSGLDCDTGRAEGEAVRADVTVTLGFEKTGFSLADGPSRCGRIVVADISLPRAAAERVLGPG